MKKKTSESMHLSKCPHCSKVLDYLIYEEKPFLDGEITNLKTKSTCACVDIGYALICPKCRKILKVGFEFKDDLREAIFYLRALATGRKLSERQLRSVESLASGAGE